MLQDELKTLFDNQAAGYDKQWARMAPMRENLHFLLQFIFADLPADARILCVGAGTGVELSSLARIFPRWHFTALDPSDAMINICRGRARADGYIARCDFHAGYVESLPAGAAYDGATCFLVSQFILDAETRVGFFRGIAERLKPGGVLASSDLAADTSSKDYEALLRAWFAMMASAGLPPVAMEKMRAAYARDVAILPGKAVASIIESAGFGKAVQFYQSGLIHAWFATRGTS
jgi:tRNA (cmo5U34)-methyltransferase